MTARAASLRGHTSGAASPEPFSEWYSRNRARSCALFDLIADPGETVDMSAQRADVLAELSTRLAAWMRATEAEPGTARERTIDPDLREQLGGLGYLGR